MAEESSLSIEETNKLRLSLGLKPLNVGPSSGSNGNSQAVVSSEDQERAANDNYTEKRKAEEKAKLSRDTAERLRKARERKERDKKIQGSTLADDDDEEDTLAWIRRQKSTAPPRSIQKVINKPERALYTEQDLQGLKVGHDLEDIESGNDVVLTLKDGDVLDDEAEVELVNVNLTEQQALQKKLENKKRKSIYTTYEDDEVDENTGKKKILARYDEDIDGEKPSSAGFVIDSATNVGTQIRKPIASKENKRLMVSLERSEPMAVMASDYAEPIAIKKPKKKKALRKTRVSTSATDPGDDDSGSTSDQRRLVEKSSILVDAIDDDEALQAALAKKRRLALQQRKLLRPEELILPAPPAPQDETMSMEEGVMDETSEFIRGLQDIKVLPARPKREYVEPTLDVPKDSHPQDVEMLDSAPMPPKRESMSPPPGQNEISTTGIEEEIKLDSGLGAAMKKLRQKGVLKQEDAGAEDRREHEAWLTSRRKMTLENDARRRREQEALRNSTRFRNSAPRDREEMAANLNRQLDVAEARAQQEIFKRYKPVVEIRHTDEFGRVMTEKETFKHMSHQFHGKESGSGKTAKKLAQIEKEKAALQKPIFN